MNKNQILTLGLVILAGITLVAAVTPALRLYVG